MKRQQRAKPGRVSPALVALLVLATLWSLPSLLTGGVSTGGLLATGPGPFVPVASAQESPLTTGEPTGTLTQNQSSETGEVAENGEIAWLARRGGQSSAAQSAVAQPANNIRLLMVGVVLSGLLLAMGLVVWRRR